MQDKIEKIEKIGVDDEVQPNSVVSPSQDRVAPNKDSFNNLMSETKTQDVSTQGTGSDKLSLMETVRDLNYNGTAPGKVSTDSLIIQTQDAIHRIDEIKQTLDSPNAHLKSSTQQLLHNKLQHINDSLSVALSRAGVEYDPTKEVKIAEPPHRGGPIDHFLGFLTDGQYKLENLSTELQAMSVSGQQLTPVNMLAVQVKVNQIQQELELFSTLLSKGLESIKTIMNIQV